MSLRKSLVILLFSVCLACQSGKEPADLVILGGKIYTMNDREPIVEAVAVRDSKIIFAGTEREARSYVSDQTRMIDLEGKVMTPGFIEGHGHIMGIGYNELELDLLASKSYEEL